MSSGEVGKSTQHFRQEFSYGMRNTVNNDNLKMPVRKFFIFIFNISTMKYLWKMEIMEMEV